MPTEQPTVTPSTVPTEFPTLAPTSGQPTASPTGFLESCEDPPPPCSEDGVDGVLFCFEFGEVQSEQCVVIEKVQIFLDLGKSAVTLQQDKKFSLFCS